MNLRLNRYERYVLPLNYKLFIFTLNEKYKFQTNFNIINHIYFPFWRFFKFKKKISTFNRLHQNFDIAKITGKKGLEPLAFGFGNQRSTN